MTKHPAENELNIKDQYRIPTQYEELGVSMIGDRLRNLLHPAAAGEHGNRDRNAEESLSHGGMRGRNCRRKKMQHSDATQYSLHDDRAQRAESEVLHPAAVVHKPRPERDDNRAHASKRRDHAVAVLVDNPPYPRRQL